MQSDDPATHYIGWMFFRNSEWTFPIGANPDYGLEIASSIFYSDSLPLFAFAFKLLSPILPTVFQYFGLWIFLCFILQAWFAWKLIGLITSDPIIKSCATGLFLLSPAMLARLYGHDPLAGHWIILAGLYLCLAKGVTKKMWKWLALVVIASLVHSYLLAMIMFLWISDTMRRLVIKELKARNLFIESFVVIGGAVISLWQAGFFMVKAGKTGSDYGQYGMNLNSLINPTSGVAGDIGWSYLLPELPTGSNGFEGFNYVGLGIIILFVSILPHIIREIRHSKLKLEWLPLVIASIGLTLFAITNNITIGSTNFFIPLPDVLLKTASIIRASGRMFWPVLYLVIWCLVFLLLRFYRHKAAVFILAIVLVAQVADTSAGWLPRKITDKDNTWSRQLNSPYWEQIIPLYKKIRVFEPGRVGPVYKEIAFMAANHNLPTDSAYLARLDHEKYYALARHVAHAIETGNYDNDSLYVIIEPRFARHAKLKTTGSRRDLYIELDGIAVVAPNWYQLTGYQNFPPTEK
jgi:hypothetical protein